MQWIEISERLPDFGVKVLVVRPNEFRKKNDLLTAYLHPARPEGQKYGRPIGGLFGGYRITHEAYWSVPAIQLLNDITHWMPIPEMPEYKDNSNERRDNKASD